MLYVQPVYIQSTGETSFPLLKKVLVMFGDKIAFEDTLAGALNVLFGGDSGVVTPVDPGTPDPGSSANPAVAKALAAAKQAFADKIAAMKAGDWTAYGAADAALKAGEDPRNVWLALCRAQSVPESRWHGLNKNTKK